MNGENFKRKCLYDMLSEITGRKRNTIRMHFFRKWKSVLNATDFLEYAINNRKTDEETGDR